MEKLEPLVKASEPKVFTIGKLFVSMNWAKSGIWANETEKQRTNYWISVLTVTQLSTGNTLFSVLIGPFKVSFAWL